MQSTFQILFIEDEPEKWARFFNNDNNSQETDILKVDQVASLITGAEAIIQNHLLLDAVLIEFNFPDVSPGEIEDLLQWKRKFYPNLPVFILCANPASEDIDTITTFIKAGAVNYFNIANFQMAYLKAHLWAARENKKTRQRYDVITTAVSQDRQGTLPLLEKQETDGLRVTGSFAYSLEAVKKPRTNEEETEFIEYAEQWHREFFRMLTLVIDDQITVSLKFIRKPQQTIENPDTVGVYWYFTINAGSLDALVSEYEKTIRDINLYLGVPSLYPNNPYVIIPVIHSTQLKSLMFRDGMFQFGARRKTVEWTSAMRQIGYKESGRVNTGHLLSVFQKPEEWGSINTFCKILAQEQETAQFSISIKPGRLSDRDKKEAKKWVAGLPENFPLRTDEADVYHKFLEGLSRSTFKIFNVEFHLSTCEQIPNDAIKAALFNTFALGHFESDQQREVNVLFEGVYPDYSLPVFARMPLPQKEGIPGINTIPQNLLYYPRDIHTDGVLVGQKTVNNQKKDIRIKYSDLAQHAYLLGQTGTGKSTMLFTMVMDMLRSGKHVSLIDPHGDLYDQVVKNLPASCRANTIFFDPSAKGEMPGINFLLHDPVDAFQKSYLLNAMYVILDNLYDMKLTGGPIFTKYLQAATKLVMENQDSLLDVIRVFENRDYRDGLISNSVDPDLRAEWNEINSSGGESSFANVSVYVTSKLNEFRNNSFLREILRKKESQIDFGEIMNQGKNLLVRLPVGTLGERGVNLVGQIIFNKFLMTAFAREKVPADQRLDHFLVVDEFHKFTTDALGKVFSEARKYHLSLVVANQTFSQLNSDVQHILLGNVGSMLFFRPGINDAHVVSRYFEPDFNTGELCNMPNYQCAARISINHRPSRPFVFETIQIEPAVDEIRH
ncbi:MAG: type IV secretion system DNA-binding domain-containing protein [Bacteroidetes bacterium]|nr:type IV secretion system DNA-binding domain-containing protein [Bacteroidota bacterium]